MVVYTQKYAESNAGKIKPILRLVFEILIGKFEQKLSQNFECPFLQEKCKGKSCSA